jgi:PAS domain S-box-containing protein
MATNPVNDSGKSEKENTLSPVWNRPFKRPLGHPTKETKVLVVDDSASVRLVLQDGLLNEGYHVLTAENGKKALEVIENTMPDFILSDVYMPEMDGLELCATLHGNPSYSHIPFVVMSTEKDAGNMRQMMTYGAAAFIIKPFNIEQLIITLNKLFSYEYMIELVRTARNEWEQTVNALPDMIAIVDLEHRFIRVNAAMQKRLGKPLEDIIGQDCVKSSSAFPHLHLELFKDRKPRNFDFFDRDGDTYFSLHLLPFHAADGQLIGSMHVFHDISEQKKSMKEKEILHTQLLQAHKLESVGQLASGIAHEINTPVQFVSSNLGFLADAFADIRKMVETLVKNNAEKGLSSDVLNQALETTDWPYLEKEIPTAIHQSQEGLSRVANLVRAMKEFSHPGGKEAKLVDINHLIETTATVARNEWKYGAKLQLDLAPDLPKILCLASEMGQVLLNLLVNAAHAVTEKLGRTPEGNKGLITITTKVDGPSVVIHVADTGCGIPDSDKMKIFEPFFTTKTVGRGTGQGLAIAYDVVTRKHGGTLSFTTAVGEGTTFTIRLPIKNAAG